MSTQAQAVRASFYGDPAGRWKTPASNENLFLGVAWDSMVFWYAILARGEKRFYSHATEIHLIGCLLDCKGWKNGNQPVFLAESGAAQWFSKSVDLQTIQPPRLLSSWPAAVPMLWPQSHRHWREFGSACWLGASQYLQYNVRGWISITIWFDVIICLILIDIMWPRYTCCLGICWWVRFLPFAYTFGVSDDSPWRSFITVHSLSGHKYTMLQVVFCCVVHFSTECRDTSIPR